MRGPQVALPEPAAAKLAELTLARDASLDAGRSAQMRANNLPANDAADAMRQMLNAESSKHAEKHRVFSMLLSRCNQWHFELRLLPGTVLETAPVDIRLGPGETVADVRREISGINQQMAAVRSAPLRKSSQKQAVAAYLARLALRVRPTVGFDVRGNATVRWPEDMVVDKGDILGVLVWAMGPRMLDELLAAFSLDDIDPPDALSPAERDKRLGDLSVRLLELEFKEAALLAGTDTMPRPEMNPMAYLGVRIAQAAQVPEAQVEEAVA
jgi:hypothetical protein